MSRPHAQALHTLHDYLAPVLGLPGPPPTPSASLPPVRVWWKTARTDWQVIEQFPRSQHLPHPARRTRLTLDIQLTATVTRPGGVVTVSASPARKEPHGRRTVYPVSSRVRGAR